MTDQEINIAIAKACGKKACDHHPEVWERRGPEGDSELYCIRCEAYLHDMRLCDYLNDLNAMNQAETELMCNRRNVFIPYCRELERVCEDVESAHVADARQRAEAFLRTIGKWRDG